MIAAAYLEALDHRGYCPVSPAEISRQVGCNILQAETVLNHLQSYDPVGIFAFDLADCLRLQLIRQGLWDSHYAIILDHLPLVARGAEIRLAELCGLDPAGLAERILVIKRLDPVPLAASQAHIDVVVPDLIMQRCQTGGIEVTLNNFVWSQLRFSTVPFSSSSFGRGTDAKKFIQEQRRQAKWFLLALERRAQTILRVGQAIADHQVAFFDQGPVALSPLTRRHLGQRLQLHETTIGRVVTGKYAMTPQGIVPLTDFFSRSLASGEWMVTVPRAARAARSRLAILLRQQGTECATDAMLADILRKEGFSIARRTVANYRKSLKILPRSARGRAIALRRLHKQTKFKS
jgi:RNA polymerase sigma-54 factor